MGSIYSRIFWSMRRNQASTEPGKFPSRRNSRGKCPEWRNGREARNKLICSSLIYFRVCSLQSRSQKLMVSGAHPTSSWRINGYTLDKHQWCWGRYLHAGQILLCLGIFGSVINSFLDEVLFFCFIKLIFTSGCIDSVPFRNCLRSPRGFEHKKAVLFFNISSGG